MARRFVKWMLPVSLTLAFFLVLALPVVPAMGDEVAEEGEEAAFSRLHEELEEFLTLMSQGKAEEAVEALEQYLQDLKALSESEGILTRDELQIAHVLYVTSKHLVVLARVYQKVPDSAREGVGNALIRSTKGHRHFYAVLEGARSGGEAEDEVEAEEEAGNSDLVDRERGGGNSGGHGNGGSRSKRGKNK
ncbi:hypothetical protein [Candidatus Solincola sp.]|nr:hypothetical protein [Actinomycetota bacterium]MDI7252556.1 hypothetical protein [Actinomycetota bacterium]